MPVVAKGCCWIIATACLFAAVMSATWSLYIPVLISLGGAVVWAPFRIQGRYFLRAKIVSAVLILAATAYLSPAIINAATQTMARWGDTVRRHGGQSLKLSDRIAIYLGNFAMASGGLMTGSPEAALETFLLTIPGQKDRYWDSDFAWESGMVRNYVEKFSKGLAVGASRNTEGRYPLVWKNYYPAEGFRIPLALNGGYLAINAEKGSGGWVLRCDAVAVVQYFKKYRSTIGVLPGGRLIVDQGAWEGLQQVGWFHPYLAHWRFSVEIDNSGRLVDVSSGW